MSKPLMTRARLECRLSLHVQPQALGEIMSDVDLLLAEELSTLVDTANYVRRIAQQPEDLCELAVTLCEPCRAKLEAAAAKVRPWARLAKGQLVTWGREGKRGRITSLRQVRPGVWTVRIAYQPSGVRPTYVTMDSTRVRRLEAGP